MPALTSSSAATRGVQAVSIAGATLIGGFFPAAAQQVALTPEQCRAARAAAVATLTQYNGQISAPLAKSLGSFIETCNLRTQFDTTPNTMDDRAFSQFLLKITAIRKTASLDKPAL